MDCTLSRSRRLAGKLVRELGRRGDRSTTDPRTALIRRELETGSHAANAEWTEALAAYRATPNDRDSRRRLQTALEAALREDTDRTDRLWFLVTAREHSTALPSAAPGEVKDPPDRPTKVGLVAYLLGTAIFLLAYLFFANRDSGQVDFVKAAAFVILSVLPGWLYLRFVHVRSMQLRDDYVLALHRLGVDDARYLPEPPRASMYYERWLDRGGDLNQAFGTIYMDKFNALFGHRSPDARARKGNRHRAACLASLLPVGVVSVICAIGWGSILLDGSFMAVIESPSVADVVRFGFLGAYAFVLQMLVRRYLQQDLRRSTYVSAAVRFLIVFVLSFVMYNAWPTSPSRALLAVAFIVGFFPIVGMQWLRSVVSVSLHRNVQSLQARYPLSQLDGLSVWYEAQLLEVGVEDMQNLLTANVVDIILNTRVPIGRLVDWIDQAALLVHLPKAKGSDDCTERMTLRRLGVRGATDLEAAFDRSDGGGPHAAGQDLTPDEVSSLRVAMTSAFDSREAKSATVLVLLKAFQYEPNLILVRNWRYDWRASEPLDPGAEEPAATGPTGIAA
jgi:hypothetical protein